MKKHHLKVEITLEAEKTPHAIVVHEKIAIEIAEKMFDAMVNTPGARISHGARALSFLCAAIGGFDGFEEAYESAESILKLHRELGIVKITVDETSHLGVVN